MSKEPANQSEKQSPMERVSAFIVDKRKAFYLLYIGVAIFCVFSSGWTAVNDDLTSYLPDTTETRHLRNQPDHGGQHLLAAGRTAG